MADPIFYCPRCVIPLAEGRTDADAVYGCTRCGGLWVDRATAERITRAIDARAMHLAEYAADHASAQVDTRPALLPCPTCRQSLARTRIVAARVDLDVCAQHGTWFDRGELQVVARTLAAARAYGRPAAVLMTAGAVGAVAGGAVAADVARQASSSSSFAAGDALDTALDVATDLVAAELVVDGGELVARGAFTLFGFITELID